MLLGFSCSEHPNQKVDITGTWKMIYAETLEKDKLKIKNLEHTSFIKIINNSHFAFFNQSEEDSANFYSGGGSYDFDGSNYQENLLYTNAKNLRNHTFSFQVNIKEDTLTQEGIEHIKDAGIHRKIIEKYIRIE